MSMCTYMFHPSIEIVKLKDTFAGTDCRWGPGTCSLPQSSTLSPLHSGCTKMRLHRAGSSLQSGITITSLPFVQNLDGKYKCEIQNMNQILL